MKIIRILTAVFILANQPICGQNWIQFGAGTPGPCGSFYLDTLSNQLYASGTFYDSANVAVNCPALWNGNNWIKLGNLDFPNNNPPYRIIKFQDTLYVAGTFMAAPGNFALRLINNSWDTLNNCPNDFVFALGEFQNRLYLGGRFSNWGSIFSSRLISYASGNFQTVPYILWGEHVECLKEYNGNLVIAGSFDASNFSSYYNGYIIGWDGANFTPIDSGLELTSDITPRITDLEIYNQTLFIGGDFLANSIGNNIISWNGANWGNVGGGTDGYVRSLQVYNGELYAAGQFVHAGNINAARIAKWDGVKWCSLGSAFNGAIWDLCVYNNELIVSGDFTEIDGIPINHIAKWIGGSYVDTCSSSTNILTISDEKEFSFYFDNSNRKLFIHSLIRHSNDYNVSIYNDAGMKIIESLHNLNVQMEIDMGSVPRGLYVANVNSDKNVVFKFLVR